MIKKNENELLDEVEKRFQTLMIGAISRFERTFGYLWNHGSSPNTENEQQFRNKWNDLRTELLNHGNNQMRLGLDAIEDYFDHNKKFPFKYNFVMDKNNNRSK